MEENNKKTLEMRTARVTNQFEVDGYVYKIGEIIGVSQEFQIPSINLLTSHPTTIKKHPVFFMSDRFGVWHAILPEQDPCLVPFLARIMTDYEIGPRPFGTVEYIPDFEQCFEDIESDPWKNVKPGDYLKYDPKSDMFDCVFERDHFYRVMKIDHNYVWTGCSGDDPCGSITLELYNQEYTIRLDRSEYFPNACAKSCFVIPKSEEDPWNNISEGDCVIYDPIKIPDVDYYTVNCLFKRGCEYIINSTYTREDGSESILIIHTDTISTSFVLNTEENDVSVKTLFRIKAVNACACQEEPVLTTNQPIVSLRDSVMYFLTEYTSDTPLDEKVLKHLPSDISQIHIMNDIIFRIVCRSGNVNGINWFIHNFGCRLDMSPEIINVVNVHRCEFVTTFELSDDDVRIIQQLYSIHGRYSKDNGYVRSPIAMILASENIPAIFKFIHGTIKPCDINRYITQTIRYSMIEKCFNISDIDLTMREYVLELLSTSFNDAINAVTSSLNPDGRVLTGYINHVIGKEESLGNMWHCANLAISALTEALIDSLK